MSEIHLQLGFHWLTCSPSSLVQPPLNRPGKMFSLLLLNSPSFIGVCWTVHNTFQVNYVYSFITRALSSPYVFAMWRIALCGCNCRCDFSTDPDALLKPIQSRALCGTLRLCCLFNSIFSLGWSILIGSNRFHDDWRRLPIVTSSPRRFTLNLTQTL